MKSKFLIIIFTFFFVNLINGQKIYEVLKIDKGDMETMNVIYLKKKSFLKTPIYRIITRKRDTINGNREIMVGDILKLKLEKQKTELFKDGSFGIPDKESFFYNDTFLGKKVNINFYCNDFIGLYPIGETKVLTK